MYAVEFQAPIENGIVHIPKQFQKIQDARKATFVVMYENVNNTLKEDIVQLQLEEYNAPKNQDNFSKDLISSSFVTLPYIF